MSRLTFHALNQWRYLADGGTLGLIRLDAVTNRMQVSVGVTLLGFGIGLTYWKRAAREWEPIEVDGWGGEPQGREHAP